MSKKIVIAVDSGKFATKAVRKNASGTMKSILFRTKMDATEEEKASDKRSCVIEYQGKRWMIGESAEKVDYEKNKAKLVHKLCTYAAIAQLLDGENNANVVLAIGCPLSIFVNVDEREKYKEFFAGESDIAVKINGVLKTFHIDDVVICPESSGIIFKNSAEYKNRLIGIIDIGGLNTNCCVYNRLSPIKSTSFTTNLGSNIMMNDLKQKINSEFVDANIQDWQIESVVKDGYIKSHKSESSELIKNFFEKHMKDILAECERKGWDLKNIDIVFTGGGSKLLAKNITDSLPDAVISKSAQLDNVEGFYIIGEASLA